jgi:hypothetical protein
MSPSATPTLHSFRAGRWHGAAAAQTLRSAVDGRPVAAAHAETPDSAEALRFARSVGLPVRTKLPAPRCHADGAGQGLAARCSATAGAAGRAPSVSRR